MSGHRLGTHAALVAKVAAVVALVVVGAALFPLQPPRATATDAPAARPPAPPARRCSAADRDLQRGSIDSNLNMSHCPSSDFLNLVYEAAFGCGRDALVVNVGANKGYLIAELVAIFAPRATVGPKRLGLAIQESGLMESFQSLCGVCWDCMSDPAPSSAVSCAGRAAHLTVHAFEPLPANVHLLRTVLEPMLAEAAVDVVSFTLHAAAVVRDAAAVPSVHFPDCATGIENCFIQKESSGKTVNVPTASLDLWARRELGRAGVIDLLFIDAEGFDPDVIRGADELLRAGRVRILQFENHAINLWRDESLEAMVDSLNERGYSCFLIGARASTTLLTACFEPALMNRKVWSNVLCIRRSERETLAAFLALTKLKWGAGVVLG